MFDKWVDNAGKPVQWWVPELYHGDRFHNSITGRVAGCGDDYETVGNAFFCGGYYSGTGYVAWDIELFREAPGDGAYYVTVAHEVGHAGQMRFIHDGESGAVPVTDVGQEKPGRLPGRSDTVQVRARRKPHRRRWRHGGDHRIPDRLCGR
jgi:hypothetical protein